MRFEVILFWLAAGATQAKIKLLKPLYDMHNCNIDEDAKNN
jgi:hypothetical protein